uniref:VP11 n=1 Tax=viral metagenome TaxID=1070528 RepID=A0A2V0RIG9_9ZZZZ
MSSPRRRSDLTPPQFAIQWTAAEVVLERVKHSCYTFHLQYRRRYLLARTRLAYYDIPIIVLSSVNSVFIAGGNTFMNAEAVYLITCMLALGVGIIQAVKTFLKVDENRENCLVTYKDLFRLFCELSIMLDQPRETRGVDPQKWMADKNSEYKEIMNKAIVLEDRRLRNNPIYDDLHPAKKSADDDSTPRHISAMSETHHHFPMDALDVHDIDFRESAQTTAAGGDAFAKQAKLHEITERLGVDKLISLDADAEMRPPVSLSDNDD